MNLDPLHSPKPLGRRQVLRQLAYMAGLSATRVSSAQGSKPPLIIQAFLDEYQSDQAGKVRKSLFDSWAKHVRRLTVGSEVVINPPFTTADEFKSALKVADCQVFPMYAFDYLEKRLEYDLEALSMPQWQNGPKVTYEIWVREDSGIKEIKDLKAKDVTMEVAGRGIALPLMVLNNFLRGELKQEEMQNYVTPKPVSSALRAILPVYFGDSYENKNSASACIISNTGMEETAKLNDDIKKRLICIHQSKPLLTHVIACRKSRMTPEQKAEIRRVTRDYLKAHESIAGPMGFEDYNPDAELELKHEWDIDQRAIHALTEFSEAETGSDQASTRRKSSSGPNAPITPKAGIAAPIQGQPLRPKIP